MEKIQPIPQAKPIPTQQQTSTTATSQSSPGEITEEQAIRGGDSAKIDTLSLGRIGDAANKGSQVGLGSLLEGKMAIEIIDSLLPAAIVLIFHAAKITVLKSAFQLTAKEKDTLTPFVQKCMDSIMINFDNPWIGLAVVASAIYGSKVIEHAGKSIMDKRFENKKNKKAASENKVSRDTTSKSPNEVQEAVVVGPLREWDEEDVRRVVKKRRRGIPDAREWLTKNWVKKGGVI